MMETPVPMPNTEVKHHSGEDSGKLRKQHAASQRRVIPSLFLSPETVSSEYIDIFSQKKKKTEEMY